MRPVTPRGFRDVLFAEAAEREAVASAMSDVFDSWGYGPVETPVVEEYATLEAAVGRSLEATAFRLFDIDGSLLALRPEMTVPIARLVVSRLSAEPGPHRFRYVAPVFREYASLRGQSRQFTQAGVELVGAPGPEGDAEIISVLADALAAAGLSAYAIVLGTVQLLRALIEAAGLSEGWGQAVLDAAHERNLVEIDRLSRHDKVPDAVGDALRAVPRIRGGADAIEAAGVYAAACGCAGVLRDIRETYRILEATGLTGAVTVDFGIMRSFDYYTGLVLEVYAPGLGLPLGGGGRYDRVLAEFGAPAPAAGFALGLERIMIALAEQGATPRVRPLDAVIGGEVPSEVFSAAAALRIAGWCVRIAVARSGRALLAEAERADAEEALEVEGKRVYRLDRAGERALPLQTPFPAPPTMTWAADREEGAR
ncbi:MAG: ATP phosphoribosyltransferase regulatory subunit [Coriobacteriia bacterium]|nr:ATP phosphoribosyltransferase regulatory subunit [Coriobacteriia bacterium]